jgi:hypothetical protein
VREALKRIIPANRQIIAPSYISTIFWFLQINIFPVGGYGDMFFHLRSGQLKSRFLSECEAVLEALKRIIPANRQIIAPSCISTIFWFLQISIFPVGG